MRRTVAAVAAVAAVLLAGCVPQTPPSPTPSPTPTFMCTPEAGGTEAPCSEQEYQKMKAKDALYAEAEHVYRMYKAEMLKTLKAGGATELPSSLAALIGTDSVRDDVLSYLRYFKENNMRVVGEGSTIEDAVRRPGPTKAGSIVTMSFCVDGRKTVVYRGAKKITGQGLLGIETAHFAGDPLKIVAVDSKQVASCDE